MSNNIIETGILDKCLALVREIERGGDVRLFAAMNLFRYNTEYSEDSFYAACRDELGMRTALEGLCEAYPDSEEPMTDAYETYLTLFNIYGVNWPERALAHYFRHVRKCSDPERAASLLWADVMMVWYKDLVFRAARDNGSNRPEKTRFKARDRALATGMTSKRIERAAISCSGLATKAA